MTDLILCISPIASCRQFPTSDGVIQTLLTLDLSATQTSPVGRSIDNALIFAELRVRAVSGSNIGFAWVGQLFKRVSGVLSAVGTIQTISSGAAGTLIGNLSAALASLDANGNSIRGRFTGIALTNITVDADLYIETSSF